MYPYIQIFGYSIGTYGLVAGIAGILSGALFIIALKKRGNTFGNGISFLMAIILGIVIGSHLLYAITQYRYIPYLFKKAEFSLWLARAQYIFGGSVFYGGLLGGLASGFLCLKFLNQDVVVYSDLLAPTIPLFHGIARIGCFLAGCCYGIPCEWGFMAEGNTISPDVNGINRFPIQLLESACNFILAGVLLMLYFRLGRYPILRGNLLKIYIIAYGVIRFADEFLRGDTYRGFWGPFSTSQCIGIITVILGSIFLARNIIRKKKDENI